MSESGQSWPNAGGELRRRLTTLAGVTVIVGAVIALLWVGGFFGSSSGDVEAAQLVETPLPAGELVNLPVEAKKDAIAPDFEFSDFGGGRHRLSDFRGQPVFLNFWATWCPPCRQEIPDIQELLDRHESDGLVVIALNRGEGLDDAKAFLDDVERLDGTKGVELTVEAVDPTDVLFDEYRGLGMPTSVFIDKDGVIRFTRAGLLSLAEMEAAFQDTVTASASGG